MPVSLTSNPILDTIIAEAKKLDPLEQQQLLVKIRLKNYLKKQNQLVAQYDASIVKPPTMAQIDKWKHDSRVKK